MCAVSRSNQKDESSVAIWASPKIVTRAVQGNRFLHKAMLQTACKCTTPQDGTYLFEHSRPDQGQPDHDGPRFGLLHASGGACHGHHDILCPSQPARYGQRAGGGAVIGFAPLRPSILSSARLRLFHLGPPKGGLVFFRRKNPASPV